LFLFPALFQAVKEHSARTHNHIPADTFIIGLFGKNLKSKSQKNDRFFDEKKCKLLKKT